jgi:hypothetical protein
MPLVWWDMRPSRRYPLIGGAAGWRLPLLTLLLLLCAAALGEWVLGSVVALLGAAAAGFERAQVVEVTARGLTRGMEVGGRLLAVHAVVAWDAVTDIESDWREPGDHTVLETTVIDRSGARIGFTSRMGLSAYRTLLAEVAGLAATARRSGLTQRLIEEAVAAPGSAGGSLDAGLLLALGILAGWAVALPWIFARY